MYSTCKNFKPLVAGCSFNGCCFLADVCRIWNTDAFLRNVTMHLTVNMYLPSNIMHFQVTEHVSNV